jgi:hypothetical protein
MSVAASYSFNRRGTVHLWNETAVVGYFQCACDRRQANELDLEFILAWHEVPDPKCRRCFPPTGAKV